MGRASHSISSSRFPALSSAKTVYLVLSHEATDDRDAYRGIVGQAVFDAWAEVGSVELEPFPAQWGIRVVVFRRP